MKKAIGKPPFKMFWLQIISFEGHVFRRSFLKSTFFSTGWCFDCKSSHSKVLVSEEVWKNLLHIFRQADEYMRIVQKSDFSTKKISEEIFYSRAGWWIGRLDSGACAHSIFNIRLLQTREYVLLPYRWDLYIKILPYVRFVYKNTSLAEICM